MVERPWTDILHGEFDRISIVHWLVFSLVCLTWAGIRFAERSTQLSNGPWFRLLMAFLGGCYVAALLEIWFPKFFQGPMVDIDPRMISLLWDKVSQVQPLFPGSWQIGHFIFWLGLTLPGIPFLFWLIFRDRMVQRRPLWILTLVGLFLFLPLAFYQVRWAAYAAILLVLPYTEFLATVLTRLNRKFSQGWRPVASASVVVVGTLWIIFVGAGVMQAEDGKNVGSSSSTCHLPSITEYLNDSQQWGSSPQTILTFSFYGPEILYRTKHSVVAIPYHRSTSGNIDTYSIMVAKDDEQARSLLKARQVKLILLCPRSSAEAKFYERSSGGVIFYDRLRDKEAPPWLRELVLPDQLAKSFKLFEISP